MNKKETNMKKNKQIWTKNKQKTDKNGWTALHSACYSKQKQLVSLILDQGKKKNSKNKMKTEKKKQQT